MTLSRIRRMLQVSSRLRYSQRWRSVIWTGVLPLGLKVTWWTLPARSMGKARRRKVSWIACGDVLVQPGYGA